MEEGSVVEEEEVIAGPREAEEEEEGETAGRPRAVATATATADRTAAEGEEGTATAGATATAEDATRATRTAEEEEEEETATAAEAIAMAEEGTATPAEEEEEEADAAREGATTGTTATPPGGTTGTTATGAGRTGARAARRRRRGDATTTTARTAFARARRARPAARRWTGRPETRARPRGLTAGKRARSILMRCASTSDYLSFPVCNRLIGPLLSSVPVFPLERPRPSPLTQAGCPPRVFRPSMFIKQNNQEKKLQAHHPQPVHTLPSRPHPRSPIPARCPRAPQVSRARRLPYRL